MKKPALIAVLTALIASAAWAAPSQKSANLADSLSSYVKLQEALSQDSLDGAKKAAAELESVAADTKIHDAAAHIAQAKSLDEARKQFKEISPAYVKFAKKAKPADMDIVHCPMAKADWVQKKGEVANPFYGKEMLNCGDKI